MNPEIKVLPLVFVNGNPLDPKLFEAIQQFCEAEFGERLTPTSFVKIWAAVDRAPEYIVRGVTGIAWVLDCPVFHVHAEEDQDKREQARVVRDALMQRAAGAIQDQWGPGTEILVNVKPEKHRFWAGFLRLIGAKAANRYVVRV